MSNIAGPKTQQCSVFVVTAIEGMKYDSGPRKVRSGGPHEMRHAASFVLHRGAIEALFHPRAFIAM